MAALSLALLGAFQVERDGQPVIGFESLKVRALLAYLVIEANRPHQREALAGLLWPDLPDETARTNLRQALANLRLVIGDRGADPPFLFATRETIQFNPASDHWLDVATFTTHLAACSTHPHRRIVTCRSCAQRMEQAAALYRGSFLDEFFLSDSAAFEEWAALQRERFHQQVLQALAHLAASYERRGAYEEALRSARRELELEPWCEEAHQQLMRALWFGGQRSAALAQYQTCRRILTDELGVEPAPETTALYERICNDATHAVRSDGTDRALRLPPLPIPPTALVGREAELADLADMLANPACRLLTLVGPGGIGKTRLAVQAAAEQRATFTDGVAYVSLAPLGSDAFLVPAIAEAVGLTFSSQPDPKVQLLNYLQEKELLLVLDNFEHLLTGAGLLGDLLRHAPGVSILVTSRERLNVQGEWVVEVAGLQVPREDQVEGIADYSAIALFLQCARRVQAEFAFSEVEQRSVVHICRLVEGMPLGIELAAAWVRALSSAEIAREIAAGLGFLTTSLRDVAERHRSLHAVFEHSWRFLSADERCVFGRLSVFRGGFGREAAERVAGAKLSLLAALIDKSLLRRTATGRYDMHELLRQYAAEQLEAAGETAPTQDRHLAFYLALAETAEPELRGAQQELWFDRLEADHDNLRAALEWGRTEASNRVRLLQLAGALVWFWIRRAYLNEGRSWLEAALAHADASVPVPIQAQALDAAGQIAWFQGYFASACQLLEQSATLWRALGAEGQRGLAFALGGLVRAVRERGRPAAALLVAEESIALFRDQGERWGLADALIDQAMAFRELDDFGPAHATIAESIALWRELGDRWGLSRALHYAALIAYRQADYADAGALSEESLLIRRALGDKQAIAYSLFNLGRVAIHQSDYTRAKTLFDESMNLFRHIGDTGGIVRSLYYQALMAHLQGDNARAKTLFEQTLTLGREAGPKWVGAAGLLGLAGVAAAQGQAWRAARLCGAAEVAIAAASTFLETVERAYYDCLVATALGELGQQAFDEAHAQGHALTLEQAIAEALDATNDRPIDGTADQCSRHEGDNRSGSRAAPSAHVLHRKPDSQRADH
jgi:predicted ATPase/DNA-binding SARP family transcriptional activator